ITVSADSLDAYKADPNWGRFWAAPAEAPKMYLAGSFTNWADGKLEMTADDNGGYSVTVQGVEQWAEFKFIEGDGDAAVWYGGDTNGGGDKYGVHPDWCTDIALTGGDAGSNFQITSGSGDLTFTISADKKLSITGWAAPANELYLAGSMTNWGEGKLAMTLGDNGKFTITQAMEAGAEFKFIDQDGTWIGGDADGNFEVQREQVVNGTELSLLLNAGNNFQIPVAGTWTLTVDKETMKLVISGEWALPKYAITIDENIENGTVTADKAEAEEGETVTLTVEPYDGYELGTLTYTVEGGEPVAIENNQFVMPAANVTVTATFNNVQPIFYSITVAESENGTVVADKTDAEEGETVTLTVTPDEGYELGTLTYTIEGAEPVAIENNEFVMPAAPVTVTATFTEIPPVMSTVTFNAEMENATIVVKAAGEVIESGAEVAEGTLVTIVVTPDEGYMVESVTVETTASDTPEVGNGAPARRAAVDVTPGDEGYTFTMPAEPVTINVTVAQIPITGVNDLRVSDNDGVRYINPMGQVSNRPFQGVNIVIDGDKTYKAIMN
ncbi:MAG: hypothetical protein IJ775_04195, partial [Muribaculaceae bacterium]|nr:hypothetical protein [Muribaculaceae bacterium]